MSALPALAAALGLVLLLAPMERVRRMRALRAGALLLTLTGWVALSAQLLPATTRSDVADRLLTPAGAAVAVGVVALGVLLAWLSARVVLRAPWAWFIALAIALPIRIPVSIGGESAKLLVPLYVVIGVGLAALVVAEWRGAPGEHRSAAAAFDGALAAMVGLLTASQAWTADPQEGATKLVFFYIPFALLYLVICALWPRTQSLRVLAVTTLTAAIPISALALWQYRSGELLWNDTLIQANVYSRFFRVNSIFFDPNVLGRYLVVALVAALAMALMARDRRTLVALGVVGLVLFAALVVTFSRSSALMLIVALAMLAWRAFGARPTLIVGIVLALGFGGLAFATSEPIQRAATSTERLDEVSEGRFELVRGGVDIWREHPVAGAGLGSFAELYRAGLSERDQARTRVVISHNAPVTVLAEVGAVGLVLLALLLVAGGFVVARRSRSGGVAGWYEWVALAILVGIFVHTLLYSALFEDPYVWLLIAAALSSGVMRMRGDRPEVAT